MAPKASGAVADPAEAPETQSDQDQTPDASLPGTQTTFFDGLATDDDAAQGEEADAIKDGDAAEKSEGDHSQELDADTEAESGSEEGEASGLEANADAEKESESEEESEQEAPDIEARLRDPEQHSALLEEFPELKKAWDDGANKAVQRHMAAEEEKQGSQDAVKDVGRSILTSAFTAAGHPVDAQVVGEFESQMEQVYKVAAAREQRETVRAMADVIFSDYELSGESQQVAKAALLAVTRENAPAQMVVDGVRLLFNTVLRSEHTKADGDRKNGFDQSVRDEAQKRADAKAKEAKVIQAKKQKSAPQVPVGTASGGRKPRTEREYESVVAQMDEGPEKDALMREYLNLKPDEDDLF